LWMFRKRNDTVFDSLRTCESGNLTNGLFHSPLCVGKVGFEYMRNFQC
jgi:hypothetical protein